MLLIEPKIKEKNSVGVTTRRIGNKTRDDDGGGVGGASIIFCFDREGVKGKVERFSSIYSGSVRWCFSLFCVNISSKCCGVTQNQIKKVCVCL